MKKKAGSILLLLIGFSLVRAESVSLDEIRKKVVDIGKLKFTQSVPVRYLKREDLIRYINQLFDEEYPSDMAQREVDFGVMMGFFDKGFSLRDTRKQLILDNLGGLYNEKTKELVALEEFRSIDMFNVLALIHELRHALQDQHFQIAKLIGNRSDFDDRSLAVLAAIEGDATLLMVKYMGIDLEMITNAFQPDTIFSFASIPGVASLLKAPNILKYQLLMPYLDGLKFSAYIFNKKSWPGVNGVLLKPPQSSEQVLHPEKYVKGEAPLQVAIRFHPQGWNFCCSGVIGEYFLNVLLKSSDDFPDTASGWGGDIYCLYQKEASRLLLWKSLWDREMDCARFFAAFRSFLEGKFKVEWRTGNTNKKPFLAGRSDFGYFFLRQDKQMIFFARTDDRDSINALINGGMYD